MSELPSIDEEARQDAPPAASPAEPPRAEAPVAAGSPPAVKPPRRWPGFGMSVVLVAVGVAIWYGATGVLRETGLYDVSRWWFTPSNAPNLAALAAR